MPMRLARYARLKSGSRDLAGEPRAGTAARPGNSIRKLLKRYRLERQIAMRKEAQIDSRGIEAGSVRYNSHTQNSERNSTLHPADRAARENRRRNAE